MGDTSTTLAGCVVPAHIASSALVGERPRKAEARTGTARMYSTSVGRPPAEHMPHTHTHLGGEEPWQSVAQDEEVWASLEESFVIFRLGIKMTLRAPPPPPVVVDPPSSPLSCFVVARKQCCVVEVHLVMLHTHMHTAKRGRQTQNQARVSATPLDPSHPEVILIESLAEMLKRIQRFCRVWVTLGRPRWGSERRRNDPVGATASR